MMQTLADFLIVDPPAARLQRLYARFSGHAYDRHRHETYAVGVTETGLQCFHYRGTARASTAGRVIVIHPDEPHDGHAGGSGGFAYRMLYVDPALIGVALGGCSLPFVSEPVFDDPALRRIIAEAFADFPEPIENLAVPSLVAALADALSRRAGSLPKPTPFCADKALDIARELLDAATSGPIGAAMLEAATGIDRYTLARGFRARFGTSPHRYLIGRRLERVKAEIARGCPLAASAYAAGFADQSHMTRHFKARFGLTPGRYVALVRSRGRVSGKPRCPVASWDRIPGR
jgi:AraC-like DNA-binding protein